MSASLVIYSATHSAAAVTAALGIEPTSSAERADGHQRSHWTLTADDLRELVAAVDGVSFDAVSEHYVRQVRWSGPEQFTLPVALLVRLSELGDLRYSRA